MTSATKIDMDALQDNLKSHDEFCGIGQAIVVVARDQQEAVQKALAPTQVLVDDNLHDHQYRLLCGLPNHDERVYPSGITVAIKGESTQRREEIIQSLADITGSDNHTDA